jgi:hypothetical protein
VKSPQKPKTKRQRSKFPNLDPTLNLKIRYDEVADLDYIDKLSPAEKAWMNKFMGEYVGAKLKKTNSGNLHNSKELKKSCYDRNNSRNRDIYSRSKARDSLTDIEELKKNQLEMESALDSKDDLLELELKDINDSTPNDDA